MTEQLLMFSGNVASQILISGDTMIGPNLPENMEGEGKDRRVITITVPLGRFAFNLPSGC